MFIYTAKIARKKFAGAAAAFALLLCAFIILMANRQSYVSPAIDAMSPATNIKTNEDRIKFLASFGWEVNPEAVETEEVRIPETFDDVYKRYNNLQKEQSFDLEKYRGKKVMRYSYLITNYPSGETGVRANILVYKDKVIAGDVSSVDLHGFMHGLLKPN